MQLYYFDTRSCSFFYSGEKVRWWLIVARQIQANTMTHFSSLPIVSHFLNAFWPIIFSSTLASLRRIILPIAFFIQRQFCSLLVIKRNKIYGLYMEGGLQIYNYCILSYASPLCNLLDCSRIFFWIKWTTCGNLSKILSKLSIALLWQIWPVS